MAWGVPKVGAFATPVASGDLTLAEPAGTAQGDLQIACFAIRSTVGFTNGDWTKIEGQLSGDTDATNGIASGEMWYRIRGASAGTLTWSRTGGDLGAGRIIGYTGGKKDLTAVLGAHSSNTLASASATATTGTISSTEAEELCVAMTSAGDNLTASAFDAATDPATASGATDTTTAPTAGTWIERSDDGTNTGADGGLAIADAVRATAGATGQIQATISASARHVMIASFFRMLVDTAVAVGVGVLTLTGFAPTVSVTDNQTVSAGVGALTLTGFAPTATGGAGTLVSPDVGALSLTGFAPVVDFGITTDVGSLTLAGFAPTVTATQNQLVEPGVGALSLTGLAPSLSTEVGAFTGTFSVASGSTSNIVVNDATNIPVPPQYVRLWTVGKDGTGTSTSHLMWSQGHYDGTSQFAVAGFSKDAQSAIATGSAASNSRCLLEVDDAAITGYLTGVSLDAHGFTLSIGVGGAFANTVTVFYEVGWGYQNAKVLNYQNDASAGSKSITGAGFQANAAHFLGSDIINLDTLGSSWGFSRGMATGSSAQAVAAAITRTTGQTTNYTWGVINTGHIYYILNPSTGAQSRSAAFTSFGADGFTINQDALPGSRRCSALLLKSPSAGFATNAAQSGTGTFNTAVVGVTPKVAWGLYHPTMTASAANGTEGSHIGWGCVTGTSQHAALFHDANRETVSGSQLTEEYSRTATDKFLVHYDRTGADTFTAVGEIARSSFGAATVVLDQTDADPTAGLFGLLAVGNITVDTPVSTGVGALVLTGFAPTVTASDHQTVSAGVGALTLGGLAPVLDSGIATDVGALTLVGFAPAVSASDNQTVAAGVGALTLAGFEPAALAGATANTETGALTLAGLAPTVSVTQHQTVLTALGVLTLTGFAPAVTASDHQTVTTGLGQLALGGFAPSLDAGLNLQTGALQLTGFAPTIAVSDHQTVNAGVGLLSLTGLAPTAQVTGGAQANTGTGLLTLNGFAPSASVRALWRFDDTPDVADTGTGAPWRFTG